MADDLQTIQDLLDSEVVVEALGFPINAKAMVVAVGDLKRLSVGEDAPAIAHAWEKLAGALGPKLMAALLSSPEWVRFCPLRAPLDDYDSSDHTQVVWLGNSEKVVATAVMDGDRFAGVRFACERR